METTPVSDSTQKAPKASVRTCAGCGKRTSADELVRVVLDPSSGEVAVDFASRAFGRGAHVHAAPACVEKAMKGGLSRVFKTKVTGDATALGDQIAAGADRRIEGLVSGAWRARQLAVGGDVVAEALKEGKAELVVVARDAAAVARLPEVERAIAEGRAIAWNTKDRLGAILSRGEVGVIAVLHAGVAEAIASAFRTSGPFRRVGQETAIRPTEDATGSEAWSSSEVR